jgi:hypothetical protein
LQEGALEIIQFMYFILKKKKLKLQGVRLPA